MSETIEFWSGPFGDDYTDRNRVDWIKRVPLLKRICERTGATSFLDVGCNAGWNLMALREINLDFRMSGIDVNHQALAQAVGAGFDVINLPASELGACDELPAGCAELVMTSGVLIHVPAVELPATLKAIRDASAQFVLAIEYASLSGGEEAVEYRGHEARLWRRDFGSEFLKAGGLALLETGVADGYDGCNYWLLEKVA